MRLGKRYATGYSDAEREVSVEFLRRNLSVGDWLFFNLVHVSASGMRRCLRVYTPTTIEEFGRVKPYVGDITRYVCEALGYTYDLKRASLVVDGYGFYVHAKICHELTHLLFPNEEPLREWGSQGVFKYASL